MRANAIIPADLSKEIRALAPLWLGCVAIVWVGAAGDQFWFRAGFLAYLLGSAALGALSIGHEYTNRTLAVLLSVPVSRRRMFALKAGVLLAMLATLAAIAIVRLPVAPAGRELRDTALVGMLSLLSSAFLAPWLTMVCRNVIAGAVFSLSIPAALLVGSELLALAVTGQLDSQASQSLRMQILWSVMLLLSAIGAVSSWRTFMMLEVDEGPRSEFRLPRLISRSAPSVSAREGLRRIHPAWSLLRKELHLQQLTFVTSVLYVCGWIATLVGRRVTGIPDVEDALLILTVVHGAIVALLSGSLASAEERHLGVLGSQLLVPMSTVRQWTIKVATVIAICVGLAMVLPAALILIFALARSISFNAPFAASVLMLAAVALYVSSLSSSGVKALIISGPVALSLFVLVGALAGTVLWAGRMAGIAPGRHVFGPAVIVTLGVLAFAELVIFAHANHRTSDRSSFRIWRHVLYFAGSMTCVLIIALIAR
jgi:hypothetical protein